MKVYNVRQVMAKAHMAKKEEYNTKLYMVKLLPLVHSYLSFLSLPPEV